MLFLGARLHRCQWCVRTIGARLGYAMLMKSTDDGLSWSKRPPFMLNMGPGKAPVPVTVHQHYAVK